MSSLKEYIDKLPPDIEQEVRDFIEFLLKKRKKKHERKLCQDWAGALKDYRDKYTSLELQKKALIENPGHDTYFLFFRYSLSLRT